MKKFFHKRNIGYFIILIINICLVIYCALQNKIQYVSIFQQKIFVGKTLYLLFGNNYINLIIIIFFSIYTYFYQKFFLKEKIYKNKLIFYFLLFFFLDILLFLIFTKRIY